MRIKKMKVWWLGLACFGLTAMGFSVQAAGLRLGSMKVDKILFLGNSITLTKRDAPQGPWEFDGGASASAVEKDYPRLVTRYIAENPAPNPERRTGYVQDTSLNPFLVTGEGHGLGDPMPVYWDGVWHLYALSVDLRTVPHFTSTLAPPQGEAGEAIY